MILLPALPHAAHATLDKSTVFKQIFLIQLIRGEKKNHDLL